MVLQSIRDRLTGILAFGILAILIVPFALVGVNEYFTAGTSSIVARVNETEITYNEFNQSYSNYRRRMQSILGASFDPLQFDQLLVRRQHLENMIEQELLAQAVATMGLDIDDDRLADEIRRIPAFQVDGQFNVDVYQSRLLSQGLSPKQFQNEVRGQVVGNQLPQNLSASSIATRTEIEQFVALFNQSRTFTAAMVPAVTAEGEATFSDEGITIWYDGHSNDYQSEERVIIEYVELDAAFMPLGPAPEDEFLLERFEDQSGRFISPEQRRVSHILIEVTVDADEAVKETTRQAAEDLSKRARDGEDFAELAIEFSQDQGSSAQGGDLGWVEPGVMVSAFETAMYELSMDAPISEPVETGFGWHVIKLQEIRESSGMSFDEARLVLLQEYEEEAAERAFLEQADRLVDLVYEDPTTLEGAALVMGLTVYEAGPFGRAGGEGIAATREVVTESFSDLVLLQGSVSDPVNLDANRLVMIRLKEHLPVALKPLEEVRDEIIATLSDKLARENAKQIADELLVALNSGEEALEVISEAAELEFARHEEINRNTSQLDATLVQEIFKLDAPAEGETVQVVLATGSGYATVELELVTDGVIGEGSFLAKRQYERVVSNSSASQEGSGFMRQLREAANVEIYEDRIK